MNKYGILLLLLLCLAALPAHGQDEPLWPSQETCIFGMPYIGHAVQKNGKGLVTDILRAVFEYDNVDLEHTALPFKRALEGLKTGRIHCTLDVKDNRDGVLQGESTLAFYDLSTAYLRATGFKDENDLKGKHVAYLHGFDLGSFLSVEIIAQYVYDLSSGFHMLDRKHADYVLGDNMLLKEALYDSKLPMADFAITKLKSFEVRPMFAPTPQGKRFRDIYDRRMKELIRTGRFREILRSHGFSDKTIQRILTINQ